MRKREFRYFVGLLDAQEKWIDRMAANGWRLVKTSILCYEFEPCEPGSYEYRVEFVGALSYSRMQDYRDFLLGLGYKVLTKSLNLNISFGKIRWRPFGKGRGQIATSPGGYNKEIFIIEKKADGEDFDIHSNYEDAIAYYRSIRGMYIALLGVVVMLLVLRLVAPIAAIPWVLFAIAISLLLVPTCLYSRKISMYKALSRTNE
ncbi:MAG TPA: DUF2812 domain-containing protein [Firmicutes bacterium]|jgi:hypothetical protein|nr:DUF2812 domain-containing protein [Bacillota bacterium]